jgi:hypothetical protein
MPLTQLETDLRLIARDRISNGQLPWGTPSRTWGGPGTGEPCALCDKPLMREEIEYEVEQRCGGVMRIFHFHVLCHAMLLAECTRDDHMRQHP